MGIFDFLKASKNNNSLFDQDLQKIIDQFELILKSKNDLDYPPPFWYDIVKQRAVFMKQNSNNRKPSEIQSEWIWMNAGEYEVKYSSYSKKDVIEAMSLRIERFGFIYATMLNFEKKLNFLGEKHKMSSYSYLEQFTWNRSSAFSSLFGTINYALKIGMSNVDIQKLYSDFIYDEKMVNGVNPFESIEGTNKEEVYKSIKENTGIDMNIKAEQIEIKKKIPSLLSQLKIEKRYAIFTILYYIANCDEITKDEHVILNDIILELDIDINEFNGANMDGNQACDLLLDLKKEEKDELARFIILIVGADGDFSSQEMIWVNDLIKEIGLDDSLLVELSEKYW